MTEPELIDDSTDIVVANSDDIMLADEVDAVGFAIALPTYADVTDEKVIRMVREECPGFTFDANLDYSKQFADPDQLADYTEEALDQVHELQQNGTALKLTKSSAALVYFWRTGYVVNYALEHASYGNGAVNKLATKLNKSVPYLYQIRAVATNLTMQDAFLLGMRECCSTTTLRKLAQIKDDDRRRVIINAFIEDTKDMTDATKTERAVKAFRQAINEALKRVDVIEQDTTNPEAVVDSDAELVNASYAAAMDAIRNLNKDTKKLSQEEEICSICDALGDLAVTESVPNAQDWVDRIKEEITHAKEQAVAARDNLNDLLVELDSALHIEVLRDESSDLDLDV